MPGGFAVHVLVQAATAGAEPYRWDVWTAITTFINTPAPYSPFSEYLAVLFMLWLLARRTRPQDQGDFNRQAQEVLDSKHASGELSRKAYDKYRQDAALRPRR
jgi:uncharacterized membrane protein